MKICHYTSIEKAFGHIIPSQKFHFSNITKTNDPYEVNFHWFCGTMASAFGDDAEAELGGVFNRRNDAKEDIKKNIRVGCMAISSTENEWDCCNNHHLWTHYASEKNDINSGCGLVFDLDEIINAINQTSHQIIWHGNVEYCPASQLDFSGDEINPAEIFCKKPLRWKEECEYRFILKHDMDIKGPTSIDISRALIGIAINGLKLNNITDNYISALNQVFPNGIRWLRRTYDSGIHLHKIN